MNLRSFLVFACSFAKLNYCLCDCVCVSSSNSELCTILTCNNSTHPCDGGGGAGVNNSTHPCDGGGGAGV